MGQGATLIRIHPQAQACGGCVATSAGPACRSSFGESCAAPALAGNGVLLDRALASLRGVVDPDSGADHVALHLVKSLRIEDGEAELTLTFPRGCGSHKLMAEDAFQALRRLLPDTDVYVRHAA